MIPSISRNHKNIIITKNMEIYSIVSGIKKKIIRNLAGRHIISPLTLEPFE